MEGLHTTTAAVADRGLTSSAGVAFVFATARRNARRHSHATRTVVAGAGCHAGFEAAGVESRGRKVRSGLDEAEIARPPDAPPKSRSGSIARQSPRRRHGHAPLAAVCVAAVGMRMAGSQARTQEVPKEVHGPSPQSSAAAPPRGRAGRLVEADAGRPGVVAADRFRLFRRHPMQADGGGATRVYVHGDMKLRTVPADAARPSARALWCPSPVESTPCVHRGMAA